MKAHTSEPSGCQVDSHHEVQSLCDLGLQQTPLQCPLAHVGLAPRGDAAEVQCLVYPPLQGRRAPGGPGTLHRSANWQRRAGAQKEIYHLHQVGARRLTVQLSTWTFI